MRFVFFLITFFSFGQAIAQQSIAQPFKRAEWVDAFPDHMSDSLKVQFHRKKLVWPPDEIYIRSFKYDRQLEVWVKKDTSSTYQLFKQYRVCMQSGAMGPKRMEGDYQVPEGFYHINEFNPNSNYHLSLGLSYPNASDRLLSDPKRPGSAIYIHGKCMSTGCIAIEDEPIEELYALAQIVKQAGQDIIPVHIFPARYNVRGSQAFLLKTLEERPELKSFNQPLLAAFNHFEKKKQLPLILVNAKGEYLVR
jgi:murein L,D-transpeptidase YafK